MIKYKYRYLLFLFPLFLVGCFSTHNDVDKYDLTGKKVVTDIDTIPMGKVGEPYSININILPYIDLSGVYGRFYDTDGSLLRSGMIEKAEKIEATHAQSLNENLLWTKEFINPQGLEFQSIQRSYCGECNDKKDYSNQLIISGIPKKAGIYDFSLRLRLDHPYFVKVFYRLEVQP